MPGISVEERKIIAIKDTAGNPIHPGDDLLIRKGGEDILCMFKALDGGYFVTETTDGKHENKYRVASIETCVVVESISFRNKDQELIRENKEDK